MKSLSRFWRRPNREFSSLAAMAVRPSYEKVPFLKEDLEKVQNEVPDFNYYEMKPSEGPYPYQQVPMSESLNLPKENFLKDSRMNFSVLENGLRIASCDRQGLTSSIGLMVGTGSRREPTEISGVSHMIELMAFKSTAHLSYLRQAKTIEVLGASAQCQAGRETILYSIECLRDYVPVMIPLLVGNVLFPRFLPWEIKETESKLLKAHEDLQKNPEQLTTHLLHQTGFHNNSLGRPLYCTEKSKSQFTAKTMRDYMLKYFSPRNMVLVGVNVDHETVQKWAMRSFLDYNAIPDSKAQETIERPIYTGGFARHDCKADQTHLSVGFPTEGYRDEDIVTLFVMQTLLGGGGSFSFGGPGKGMHSRLFSEVLSRYAFVESAISYNTAYGDAGLFGIQLTGPGHAVSSLVQIGFEQIRNLTQVREEDLKRAKNCLTQEVFMNLETRSVLLEEVGYQLLMSDKLLTGSQFAELVGKVKIEDVSRVARRIVQAPPTVVAVGDCSQVPHYNQFLKLYGELAK